jgi:hypothetical protein
MIAFLTQASGAGSIAAMRAVAADGQRGQNSDDSLQM